jgi:hypothetical protein
MIVGRTGRVSRELGTLHQSQVTRGRVCGSPLTHSVRSIVTCLTTVRPQLLGVVQLQQRRAKVRWMNTLLLNRSLGAIRPRQLRQHQQELLLHALQPAQVKFNNVRTTQDESRDEVAHNGGTNTLVIDKFEGR